MHLGGSAPFCSNQAVLLLAAGAVPYKQAMPLEAGWAVAISLL